MAFSDVYDAHAEFVFRSLCRLGVKPAAAEDALQEVFMVVHRRLGELTDPRFLRTWLFRISIHVAQNARRSARAAPEPVGPKSLEEAAPSAAWTDAERSEQVQLLHHLLEALPDDKRSVFILAELEEMTMPEIAEALGLNLNTAYARLRSARRLFDEALARHRDEEGRAP